MTRLNQILAVEKGIRSDADRALTESYHRLQKTALQSGLTRTYHKRDDADPDLPGESTPVQVKVGEVLEGIASTLTNLFNVTAAKDWTNCGAYGDIAVDGTVLVKQAPVSYLLFLEKQLVHLETVIRKLPVLDPAESWTWDEASGAWKTSPTDTARTKKIPRNHVKAPPTDKHPAQVEVYYEDTIVGTWRTVKFSGALPATRVRELLSRVLKLAAAVKVAREEANMTQVVDPKPGKAVFEYLFA